MTIIVKRELFDDIYQHLIKPEITIITGARQVGKTTLLDQLKLSLQKDGIASENIYSFNLDIITDQESFKSQADFIKFLKSRIGGKRLYVFVDEAQRIENAGIFFKGIYDLKLPLKFVLTGSSSLELRSKIHEPLTGRKRLFHMKSFSFLEFLRAKEKRVIDLTARDISKIDQRKIMDHFLEYLVYGGYPKVVLETNFDERVKILEELYSSYIEKDIVGFINIKNPSVFLKLLKLLSGQIGHLINVSELSNTLGIEVRTVNNYLNYLEETFVISLVRPFYKNPRKEITKMPKCFFMDLGLRNFALSKMGIYSAREDRGDLLENYVFLDLKNRFPQVNFWRTKSKGEVDFVVADQKGEFIPFEVKATNLKSMEIPRSFRSFIRQYNPSQAYLINLALEAEKKLDETKIKFVLPFWGLFNP